MAGLTSLSGIEPSPVRAAQPPARTRTEAGLYAGPRWWENPNRLRSGRVRPSGIMNWGSLESLKQYEHEVAFLDCGTQRSINKLPSWEAVAGGPLRDTGHIAPHSQLDWAGTPIGVLMDYLPPGNGWLIWGVWAMKTGEAANTEGKIWKQVADGAFDQYYVDLGSRARRILQERGWPLDCLLLRWNKEFNQEDSYGITDGQHSKVKMPVAVLDWYVEAMGRVIAKFKEGYGKEARHIFSPARNLRLFDKPLESFFTPGAYDLISLSYHPSSKVTNRETWDKMISGTLDGGYGDLDAIRLCQKHGLPFCHDEWSPRFEPKLGCRIPAQVYEWTWDFWNTMEKKHGVPLAFDCVYSTTALNPSLYPEWGDGVKTFKKLWAGKKPESARAGGAVLGL